MVSGKTILMAARRSCVLLALLCVGLLGVCPSRAEDTPPLKNAVLVLPLQAGPDVPADKATLGLAVQNVIENLLAVHSTVEENWTSWHLPQLFPKEQDFHDWVHGKGEIPAAAQGLGFRYLLTGRMTLRGEEVHAALELLDRSTQTIVTKELRVDLPGVEIFRQGVLDVLAQANIPAPEAQKPKMLWKEGLPLSAAVLLGQGLSQYLTMITYHREQPQWNPTPFEEGLKQAPGSYLLLNNLGWVLHMQKQYAAARTHFERALAVNPVGADAADGMVAVAAALGNDMLGETWARKKADSQGKGHNAAVARFWGQRGDHAFEQADYAAAMAAYQKAMALDAREVMYVTSLAMTYQRVEKWTEAQQLLEQALRTASPPEARTALRLALADLHVAWAGQLEKAYAYEEAITHYQAALAIDKQYRRWGAVTDLIKLGTAYGALSQNARAIEYYEQALEIAREVKDRAGEGRTLNNLGTAYRALSQYEKAIASYEQALTIRREVQDRVGEGTTLSNLGAAYQVLGLYEKAIAYYEQALTIAREVQDRVGEGTTLSNLGAAYRALSQYDQAIAYYEQALAIRREVKDRAREGITLSNLGGAYRALSQYAKAIEYYEQALAIAREVQNRAGEGTRLNNLGAAYDVLGQYEHAIAYYEQALTIAREVQDRAGEGTTLNNLGAAYDVLGQYEHAIAYYEQALAIAREVQNRAGEGTILNNLGLAHAALSQYSKAIAYYEQALAIAREVQNRAGEGTTLSNLMGAWQTQGMPRMAIFYGKQAVNVYQAIRQELHGLDQELRRSFLKSREGDYRALVDLLLQEGRTVEAEQVMRMLKEEEFFEFLRRDRQAASPLLSTVVYTPGEAQLVAQYQHLAETLTRLGQERQPLQQQAHTEADTQRLASLEAELDSARQALTAFLQGLPATFAAAKSTGETTVAAGTNDVQALVRQAEPGTVVLWTLLGKERSWVVLVSASGRTIYKIEQPATTLVQRIAQFRTLLRSPHTNPLPLAQELYGQLFAPLTAELETLQAHTLLWSLDGQLRYIPIAALHDGQHYVLERYGIGVFPLAGQQLLGNAAQEAWKAAGFGVSEPVSGFKALLAVPAELHAIIREGEQPKSEGVLPGIIRLNARFTATELQQALTAAYPVVHIASHFQLRPGDAAASFLLLGGGQQLPVAELTGYHFGGVELLALSACETGLGSDVPQEQEETEERRGGKEVESFAMLVQYRGAQAVLASLWAVADASTKEVMAHFYALHGQTVKLSKVEALRQAQLQLLRGEPKGAESETKRGARDITHEAVGAPTSPFVKDPQAPYAHPYYWAPFILIGNWK